MLVAGCGRFVVWRTWRSPQSSSGVAVASPFLKCGQHGSWLSSSLQLLSYGELGSRPLCDGLSSSPSPRQQNLQTLLITNTCRLIQQYCTAFPRLVLHLLVLLPAWHHFDDCLCCSCFAEPGVRVSHSAERYSQQATWACMFEPMGIELIYGCRSPRCNEVIMANSGETPPPSICAVGALPGYDAFLFHFVFTKKFSSNITLLIRYLDHISYQKPTHSVGQGEKVENNLKKSIEHKSSHGKLVANFPWLTYSIRTKSMVPTCWKEGWRLCHTPKPCHAKGSTASFLPSE